MSSVEDVARGLGAAFLPKEEIAPRLAQRAGKVAATAASRLGEPDYDVHAFSRMDVTKGLPGAPNGLSAVVYGPSQFKAEPELFWGPFMQLGTYLEIEDPAARFLVDALADPLNLLTFGTGTALNATGKLARLVSTATKGGRAGRSYAKALSEVESVLKVVGAAAESPQWHSRLMDAAKQGITGRKWRGLIDEGLAIAEKLPEGNNAGDMLRTLRKDRKAFLDLMEAADQLGDARQGPAAFLQGSFRDRAVTGQTNPFVRVDNPFPLVRQVLGLGHRGESFFLPLSRGMTGGLLRGFDHLGGKALARPLEGLADDLVASSGETLQKNLGDVPDLVGTQYANDFIAALTLDAKDLGRTAEGRSLLADLAPSEKTIKQLKRRYGLKGTSNEDLTRWLTEGAQDAEELTLAQAQARSAARHQNLLKTTRKGLIKSGIEPLEADEMVASVRRAHQVFGLDEAKMSADGIRDTLLARVSAVDVAASNLVYGYRDIVKNSSLHRRWHRPSIEVLDRIRENPKLFTVDDKGVTRLTGAVEENSRLNKLFQENPGFEDFLLENGLPRELGDINRQMGEMYDKLGKHLFESGINPGFVSDYAQRVFEFEKSIFDDTKGMSVREFIDDNVLGNGERFPDLQEVAEKVREGKMGFIEARTATEEVLLAMEDKGLGRFKKDSFAIYGGYLSAANRAVTADLMIQSLPKSAPRLTDDMFDSYEIAQKYRDPDVTALISKEKWDSFPLKKQNALKARGFVEMASNPRYRVTDELDRFSEMVVANIDSGGRLMDEVRKGARAKLTDSLTKAAGEESPGALLKRLIGKTGTVRRRKGAPYTAAEFAEFVAADKYPSDMRNIKAIKGQVSRELDRIEKGLHEAASRWIKKTRDKVANKPPEGQKVYVVRSIEPQVRELFRAYGEAGSELIGGKWLRKYDRLNTSLKSFTLAIDIFHQNVLAYSSLIMDPGGAMDIARKQAGVIARHAAIGGAAGGAATATVNQDPAAIAAGTVAGALYAGGTKVAMANAHRARKALLNPAHAEHLAWMGRGGFTGNPDDRSIGGLLRGIQRFADNLRRESKGKMLISPITGAEHMVDAFEHGMWSTMQLGSKQAYFTRVFDEAVAKLPDDLSDAALLAKKTEIAKEAMASANTWLGGQRFSWLLGDPQYQDAMRKFLLAPDWTLANLMGASSVFANMGPIRSAMLGGGLGTAAELVGAGFDTDAVNGWGTTMGAGFGLASRSWMKLIFKRMTTKGDVMAKEARKIYASALLGGYFFGNLMNKAFTGHWMFENPEGRQTSIALGGTDADGKPLYLKLGKPWKEAFEFASIFERDQYPVPVISRTHSKLAVIPRTVSMLFGNDNGFGRQVIDTDSSPLEFGGFVAKVAIDNVTPFVAQTPLRLGGAAFDPERNLSPASLAEAVTRIAGFSVNRDQRPRGADYTALLASSALPPNLSSSIFVQ